MRDEFEDTFEARLTTGEIETITKETHPFAMTVSRELRCDRCGDSLDDEARYRIVAYLEEDGDRATVRPHLIGECMTCVTIEDRFHDARYATATA